MKSFLFSFLFLFSCCCFAQQPAEKMLFIIDSVPLYLDPEPWNSIEGTDIADFTVVKNKDSVRSACFERMDALTYIFTKAYRARTDSIKAVPTQKLMKQKAGTWQLNGKPYTGRYIDYYNNGSKQSEGFLHNGKLEGKLKVFYKNGSIQSIADYKDGLLNGDWIDYYRNGTISSKRLCADGKIISVTESNYSNGQPLSRTSQGKMNGTDTTFKLYSTGKIKQITLYRNGYALQSESADLVFLLKMNEEIRKNNLRLAKKYCAEMMETDTANADAFFYRGFIYEAEFRFDKAIADFDKCLSIEPLMQAALQHRAVARIKKYQFMAKPSMTVAEKTALANVVEKVVIPAGELEKICNDFELAADQEGLATKDAVAQNPYYKLFCQRKQAQ